MKTAQLAKILIEGPRVILLEDTDPKPSFGKGETDDEAHGRSNKSASHRRDHQPVDNDEEEMPEIDKKIGVFLNRAILRIFSVPSMMQYLKDVVLFAAEGDVCKIQFVFHRLPEEAVPQLTKLLAAPRDPKYTRFIDKGQARTGVELDVQPDDFGGEEYEYAF